MNSYRGRLTVVLAGVVAFCVVLFVFVPWAQDNMNGAARTVLGIVLLVALLVALFSGWSWANRARHGRPDTR
jgi:hypothetical protein